MSPKRDANDVLREEGPDALRAAFDQSAHQQHEDDQRRANGNSGATSQQQEVRPAILPKAEFLKGFVPPDYIIDGMLQRRFIYSLTGQTGHAKTAIALVLANKVALQSLTVPSVTIGSQRAACSISSARIPTTSACASSVPMPARR